MEQPERPGEPEGKAPPGTAPEPGPAEPETAAEPAAIEPETAAEPGAVEPETAAAPVRARRRGRTALLIAGAVVLGLVAGTCTGYLVQADREPTKLPPLSQPTLKQSKGEAPEPLSAARDRHVRTDGDLRKLLLKKPRGAKDADWSSAEDGWMDLASYAEAFERPKPAFAHLVGDEFRRAAVVAWEQGQTAVEIRLVQYRQEESMAASERSNGAHYWADDDGNQSWPVPGTEEGMAYAYTKPETKPGYLPEYKARAFAWRGDIEMEIFVSSTKPVGKKTILGLAKRQMERL
ncbi:hypothetical protein ACFXGG_20195 [Streptomyces nigra]|uniref:hypothetical protein n=1 Tax=Streptomyces TaxID=1883 RepID=UPI000D52A0AF|nr:MULTISPECIES: hypothetical protein [Streptomyces]AWE51060.1 hypothetical protein DC008_15960 [Streptomyces nigra]MCF2535553.1 hypothetical protein [Streptomyces sp. FB2]